MNDLRSGDLCIPGSDAYGDYRAQLVPWETYGQEIAAYTEQAGLPATPHGIVAALRERLTATCRAVHRDPDLSHFEGIVPCGIADRGVTSLAKLGLSVPPEELDRVLVEEFEGVFGR